MKKIPFKNITTREELITRLEMGHIGIHYLFVGSNIKYIQKFLKPEPTSDDDIEVNVNYSTHYGTSYKKYWI